MLHRVMSLVAALAVFVFVSAVVAADKPTDKASDSKVTGTVSKVGDNSITVTDKDGKDHQISVAKDAKVTCDGKDCKLADLKEKATVTVTLNPSDKTTATAIDAKSAKDNK